MLIPSLPGSYEPLLSSCWAVTGIHSLRVVLLDIILQPSHRDDERTRIALISGRGQDRFSQGRGQRAAPSKSSTLSA
ncbi:hypothetical protein CSOJ01_07286 [Colletotrichum sojae]|uniref:Uncharacterized protein n=1 Tax=Colletotrichum sojae TaxID=2175907 RepID=A0A8H6MUJ1_9PEZI|nr:hypothetical protein CSOJ01_07286 [Colletotrichum sojae]